ncbi:brain-specific angiogenesis inhibitor 1-associated protein 2 [Schistocerca cancellata]|uniref:brain-specific angiogenesis inhibitor 1-associated protein 2 n=1 Tax=Schistocerca cancellata TaxID=274614 RepID=UPI0021183B21|nr:brain-specific angiogenesis inhibitor 1-associated protein 2 [Schistocerca cancellata]
METEEITKLVDGIYKNILDKFNPGARQLIQAGKAYLKALHGAAAASRLYVDAISKLAKQAQQGTWGASADVGSALMQIVDVYKETHAQQMNILKAFYVDLLVPLETNLEKDTKVVQSEQKRFLQQHKQRSETYSKAAAAVKKQRKKTRTKPPSVALDREVKSLQALEEERAKLDAFCEASLKTAMTQERRRYGFVLERQCSLAKHYLLHHTQGKQALEERLDSWQDVAHSREALPEGVEAVLTARLRQVSFWPEDSPGGMEDDRLSLTSQLRKTKSMDASCLDMRSIGEAVNHSPMKPLSRAKSDFNLAASTHSLEQEPEPRPKSMAVASGWDNQLARALYAYLSSGDNQLSFLEGDLIALIGERNKGWQFGENLRTQCTGWFPLAYTELLLDGVDRSPTHGRPPDGQSVSSGGSGSSGAGSSSASATTPGSPTGSSVSGGGGGGGGGVGGGPRSLPLLTGRCAPPAHASLPPARSRPPLQTPTGGGGMMAGGRAGPPPPLPPAPVPRRVPPPPLPPTFRMGATNTSSLHSSNDSGFSNPTPEADFSDDDSVRSNVFATVKLRKTKTNDRSAPLIL